MIRVKDYAILKLDTISPNPEQHRRDFPRDSLLRLGDSIRGLGLIEDLVVRETSPGRYVLVCGERRWKAAQLAGIAELPAKIVEITDDEVRLVALAENLHRENLTDVRLGFIYRELMRAGAPEGEIASSLSLSGEDVIEKLGLLDQSALVDHQQVELERLRRRLNDLETEIARLRLEIASLRAKS